VGKVSAGLSGCKVGLVLGLVGCCPANIQDIGFEMAAAETTAVLCADAATREKVRGIMMDALDDALKNHIVHMFEVWMRDDRGQPERARTGVVNGISAYIKAGKSVQVWAPPDCPG